MEVIESFPTGKPLLRTEGSEQLLCEIPKISEELYDLAYREIFYHFIFELRDCELLYRTYKCSYCGAEWDDYRDPARANDYKTVTAKHNSEVFCPYCGTAAEKKIVSKCGHMLNLDQWRDVLFIIRHSENRVYGIRGSLARYHSYGERKSDKMYFAPDAVHVWMPGRAVTFLVEIAYDLYNHIGYYPLRFKEAADPGAIGKRHGSVTDATYVIGTEQIKGTFLQWSGLVKVLNTAKAPSVFFRYDEAVRWLTAYVRNPSIEFLTKFPELTQIIYATICQGHRCPELFNWRAKTPDRFFRMSKPEVKWLISPKSVKHDLIERLKFRLALRKYYPETTLMESDYMYTECGSHDLTTLLDIIGRVHGTMSLKQIDNYIIRQCSNFCDRYIGRYNFTLTSWRDYLNMAIRLKYDLTDRIVLAPKNLREAHDRAVDTESAIKVKEIKAMSKKRKKLLDTLYNWSDGDILIRPPVDAAEIVAEGQKLHHCVGGYAKRHCEGNTTILFVRRCSEPDIPLYTMELDAKSLWTLKQIHGYKNCAPEQKDFEKIKAWLAAEGKPEKSKEAETISKEKAS